MPAQRTSWSSHDRLCEPNQSSHRSNGVCSTTGRVCANFLRLRGVFRCRDLDAEAVGTSCCCCSTVAPAMVWTDACLHPTRFLAESVRDRGGRWPRAQHGCGTMLAAVLQRMCGADVDPSVVDPSVGMHGHDCHECACYGEEVFCPRADVPLDLRVGVGGTSCCRGA